MSIPHLCITVTRRYLFFTRPELVCLQRDRAFINYYCSEHNFRNDVFPLRQFEDDVLEGRAAHFLTIEKVNKMVMAVVFCLSPSKNCNCCISVTGSGQWLVTESYRRVILNFRLEQSDIVLKFCSFNTCRIL